MARGIFAIGIISILAAAVPRQPAWMMAAVRRDYDGVSEARVIEGAEILLRTALAATTEISADPAKVEGLSFTARFAPDGQSVIYGASWNGLPTETSAVPLSTTKKFRPPSPSVAISWPGPNSRSMKSVAS